MSKVTVRPAESAASDGGLGTRLYIALLDLLRQDHVHVVVSVVAQRNPASNALHRKLTKPACCAETTESCSPTIGFGGFMARSEGG